MVEKKSKRQRRMRSKKGKIANRSKSVDSLYSSEEERGCGNEEEKGSSKSECMADVKKSILREIPKVSIA